MAKKASKAAGKAPVPPPVKSLDPTEPKLTRALVERLYYVHTERKRLEAAARVFQTEEEQLRDVAFAWLEEFQVKEVVKFGFRVAQKLGRVVVPWREAYIREVGVKRAEKLQAESPRSISLQIEATK